MPHISIKAEQIINILGLEITNSLLASFVTLLIIALISIFFYKNSSNIKSNFIFLIKFFMNALYSLFEPILKEKTERVFPILASFFLFILISNWFGLLPGVGSILIQPIHTNSIILKEKPETQVNIQKQVDSHSKIPILRAATADLNTTFALAIISIVLVQYYGFSYLGLGYLKKFFNFANPIMLILGLLELVSEFSKILSFAFRLFGNIFAGEVLLSIVAFLVPILASFPFLMLELFVGIVQALVFSMLTAVFISGATIEHH